METGEDELFRMVSVVARLKGAALFRGVSDDYLAGIARISSDRTLCSGEVLFSRGDPADGLYLVREGRLRVTVEDREVARPGPGECVGEMGLIDAKPRSATVAAAEPTALLFIGGDEFADLLAVMPGITTALLKTLAGRVRQMRARLGQAASRR